MPVIKNEQDVKQKSMFLKYEAGDMGNMLIIKSHLYQVDSHFLKSVSRSVACREDTCMYCAAGYPINSEYNYMVDLNGQTGYLNVKGSVFFAIKGIAKAQKRDVRQISWTVIKTGEGLKTEYTTSKDDNLADEDFKRIQDNLDSNTDKLIEVMEKHEEELDANYGQYLSEIRGQETPGPKKKQSVTQPKVEDTEAAMVEDLPDGPEDPSQVVHPDDVPF